MSITETPYLETFGCRLDDGEDHDHPGDCDWGYACGTCGRPVDDSPCPAHAPLDIPGLMLTECTTAEPRHPRTWVIANDGGYGAPCMYCCYDLAVKAHAGCEHSHHGRWRRWRIASRLLGDLYSLGIVACYGHNWGGGCRGCLTNVRFGRNGYLLGQENEWWTCLLRHHHVRRPDPDCPVICDVCSPPDTGTT